MLARVLCVLGFAAGCDDVFDLEAVIDAPRATDAADDDAAVDAAPEACPSTYATFAATPQTSRYLYVSQKVIWSQAAEDCANDTQTHVTHLVVFDDMNELTGVRTIPNFTIDYFLWVGYARNTASHGGVGTTFYSVTGEELGAGSPLWSAGEPNNGGGNYEETTVYITPDVTMTDDTAVELHS